MKKILRRVERPMNGEQHFYLYISTQVKNRLQLLKHTGNPGFSTIFLVAITELGHEILSDRLIEKIRS